jgi:serine/threonine protein kinase
VEVDFSTNILRNLQLAPVAIITEKLTIQKVAVTIVTSFNWMPHSTILDSIGQNVGRFSLTRRIGIGSTCVVSEVKDIATGKIYAAKIIPFTDLSPLKLKQAIDREVRVLRRIKSPHICSLHDVIETDRYICLVLEHCGGGTLLKRIMQKQLSSMNDMRKIFREVTQAVQHLHDRGIAHGDIKADNVVFDADGKAKLIDLGYCKERRIGCESDKCGTLHYAAPELLKQGHYDTQNADVWSLGILLHVIVSGRFPYPSNHNAEVRNAILSGELQISPKVTGECRDLMMRMTARKPKDRPTLEQILASTWVTNGKGAAAFHASHSNLRF